MYNIYSSVQNSKVKNSSCQEMKKKKREIRFTSLKLRRKNQSKNVTVEREGRREFSRELKYLDTFFLLIASIERSGLEFFYVPLYIEYSFDLHEHF